MKIGVLNGSPKGKNSITLQTMLYLEKKFPMHEFQVLNVGVRIKQFERDFSEAKEFVESADLLMFIYPVYTFIVPYQMHRFIELMKENQVEVKDKYASQMCTSKHFFDVTAHKFIEMNCYDMGLRYNLGFSSDMEDLLEKEGQKEATLFFDKLLFNIEHDIYLQREPMVHRTREVSYQKVLEVKEKTGDKDVVIVTSCAKDDVNLRNMIEEFKSTSIHKVREINIREFPFKGGCLGCMGCTFTEKCVYKDGFDEFLRTEIQNAQAIVYAFTIENHYAHSCFKCYDDRQFCNGHRTVDEGTPCAYILSGDYEKETNLQMIVEGRSEVAGMYLAGVATDEKDPTGEIEKLALSLEYALEHKMSKPANFYGVGGTKIFRDLIYLMQGMMQADHKFYKKHGIYDFPQKKKKKILQMIIIGKMMENPKVQKKMKSKMSEYIVTPYKKLIDEE